jgi:general L-amino acid transport system permease protein
MNTAHPDQPEASGRGFAPNLPAAAVPIPMERPPRTEIGVLAWLRHNLFSSPFNAGLTLILAGLLGGVSLLVLRWTVLDANWGVILKNWRVILFGVYPRSELWRPAASLIIVLGLTLLTVAVWRRAELQRLRRPILVAWIISPFVIGLLLGGFELPTLGSIGNNLGYFLFRPDLLPALNAGGRGPIALALVAGMTALTWGLEKGRLARGLSAAALAGVALINLPSAILLSGSIPTALPLLAAGAAGWIAGRWLSRLLSWTEKGRRLVRWLWLAVLIVCVFVLTDFTVGRPEFDPVDVLVPVQPSLWSGVVLTLVLATVTAVLSFPLGVLLALGRASRLPVVRASCVGLIEVVRGVPLIAILFMAQVMLPMFLPMNVSIDRVLRAIAGMTIFTAAYLAEVIRGGLQAVPREQVEAARALGLSEMLVTGLVVLPQALRLVIPAIMGQFVSMFKDTTLVAIIGLLELLGILSSITKQREFLGTVREVYLVAAAFYFVICYAMSLASRRVETRLGVGTR